MDNGIVFGLIFLLGALIAVIPWKWNSGLVAICAVCTFLSAANATAADAAVPHIAFLLVMSLPLILVGWAAAFAARGTPRRGAR